MLRRLLFLAIMFGMVGAAQAAGYAGRPVVQVLNELRATGLAFVYNSQILGDDLRVLREPEATGGIEVAREILSQHGLTLTPIAGNTFAVVRSAQAANSETPVQPPPPASPPMLDEVVVHTSRYTFAKDPAAHIGLTQEQVQNLPRLADEALRAVQHLPGTTTNGFSSIGSTRGGEPKETSIILDGLRLYEPFHLKNFLSPVSLLDSRVVANMDVYSGGYPTMYGDRMSAIIDATTVRPEPPRYLEVGASLYHLHGLISQRFASDRASLLLSARRSNLGDLSHLSESDFGEPNYADGLLRLEYRFDEATTVALETLLSNDQIHALRAGVKEQARADYNSAYTWATVSHQWSDRLGSRLIASFTDVTNDRSGSIDESGIRTGAVNDQRSFNVLGIKNDNQYAANEFVHRFGAELRQLHAEYDYASDVRFEPGYPFPGSPLYTEINAFALRPEGHEASVYYDVRAELHRRWSMEAGLRFDTQTYDDASEAGYAGQWSPRASVLYRAGDATRWRASWGRFFQSQGINELQVEDGVDRFQPVQHADHTIVSVEHDFANASVRVEAYRKQYRRINRRFENALDPLILLPELAYDRVAVGPGHARAEGVEALLRVPLNNGWSGWLGYAWSRVYDDVAGEKTVRSWDQTHAINLGLVWRYGGWTVTATDSFHTGWPSTELESVSTATSEQIVFGPRNAVRFGDYNSFDVRVAYSLELSHGSLDMYVEASNLFSQKNPCCAQYSIQQAPGGSLTPIRDTDYWLPLVPSAGLLWRY